MTIKGIQKMQDRENIKYELAKKIRAMLDEEREKYGKRDWDDEDVETAIIDLVTGED